jgi:hypothetical protein
VKPLLVSGRLAFPLFDKLRDLVFLSGFFEIHVG